MEVLLNKAEKSAVGKRYQTGLGKWRLDESVGFYLILVTKGFSFLFFLFLAWILLTKWILTILEFYICWRFELSCVDLLCPWPEHSLYGFWSWISCFRFLWWHGILFSWPLVFLRRIALELEIFLQSFATHKYGKLNQW